MFQHETSTDNMSKKRSKNIELAPVSFKLFISSCFCLVHGTEKAGGF